MDQLLDLLQRMVGSFDLGSLVAGYFAPHFRFTIKTGGPGPNPFVFATVTVIYLVMALVTWKDRRCQLYFYDKGVVYNSRFFHYLDIDEFTSSGGLVKIRFDKVTLTVPLAEFHAGVEAWPRSFFKYRVRYLVQKEAEQALARAEGGQ